MKAKVGKEKRVFESKDVPVEIADAVRAYGHDKLDAAVRCADKQQRDAQESEVRADVLAHFEEIYPDNLADVNKAFDAMTKEIVRHMITVEKSVQMAVNLMKFVQSLAVQVSYLVHMVLAYLLVVKLKY